MFLTVEEMNYIKIVLFKNKQISKDIKVCSCAVLAMLPHFAGESVHLYNCLFVRVIWQYLLIFKILLPGVFSKNILAYVLTCIRLFVVAVLDRTKYWK